MRFQRDFANRISNNIISLNKSGQMDIGTFTIFARDFRILYKRHINEIGIPVKELHAIFFRYAHKKEFLNFAILGYSERHSSFVFRSFDCNILFRSTTSSSSHVNTSLTACIASLCRSIMFPTYMCIKYSFVIIIVLYFE